MQLAARGAGSLAERLAAVRAAHANWNGNKTAKFEYRRYLPSLKGAEQAEKNRAVREEGEPQELMEREFEARYKRTETVFKDPRALNVNLKDAPGVVSSEDGRLRIVSWDTGTGGTMNEYCSMAQFKSPDGKAGFALLDNPGEKQNADPGKQPAIFWLSVQDRHDHHRREGNRLPRLVPRPGFTSHVFRVRCCGYP